jgi:hemoglobin
MTEDLQERPGPPPAGHLHAPRGDAALEQPRRDLEHPDDVAEMVRRFYADVDVDDLLGPMFNEVAQVDWDEHLPKLTAFWCRALFGINGYAGNPFRAHQLINQQRQFTDAHFHRWLTLFHRTVDEGWVGANAEAVKTMAVRVAAVHSRNLGTRPVAPRPSSPQGQVHQVTIANRTPQETHD